MQVYRGQRVHPPQQGLIIQWITGLKIREVSDPAGYLRYVDKSGLGNYAILDTNTGKINLNPNDNAALRSPNAFLTRGEIRDLQNGDEDFTAWSDGMYFKALAYPTSTVFGDLDETAAALFWVRRYPLLDGFGGYLQDGEGKILYRWTG
jgi:hypothetical protein